jgi:hypothetical protein
MAWRRGLELPGYVSRADYVPRAEYERVLQENAAWATRIRALEARADEAYALRPLQVHYLSPSATISGSDYNKFRRIKAECARSEKRAGLWPTTKASHKDIERELGEKCSWGGSCQPWIKLPADRIHDAFVVLARRQRTANKLGGNVSIDNFTGQQRLSFN